MASYRWNYGEKFTHSWGFRVLVKSSVLLQRPPQSWDRWRCEGVSEAGSSPSRGRIHCKKIHPVSKLSTNKIQRLSTHKALTQFVCILIDTSGDEVEWVYAELHLSIHSTYKNTTSVDFFLFFFFGGGGSRRREGWVRGTLTVMSTHPFPTPS